MSKKVAGFNEKQRNIGYGESQKVRGRECYKRVTRKNTLHSRGSNETPKNTGRAFRAPAIPVLVPICGSLVMTVLTLTLTPALTGIA